MPNGNEQQLWILFLSIVANAATTWGVVSTKLAWLRKDVDAAHTRIDDVVDQLRRH